MKTKAHTSSPFFLDNKKTSMVKTPEAAGPLLPLRVALVLGFGECLVGRADAEEGRVAVENGRFFGHAPMLCCPTRKVNTCLSPTSECPPVLADAPSA